MTPTWSLVSTMHGIPETVLPCIAHHLRTDARNLHIYLDRPNPGIEGALAGHPRCIVTVCDEAYWARRPKGRPAGLGRRQLANLRHAIRHADSDWLVHLDSDEFLVAHPHGAVPNLSAELSRIPASHDWARIAPLERVLPQGQAQQGIFDGIFRAATPSTDLPAIYGAASGFLTKGLSGHTRGKIAFRRNTVHVPRIHELVQNGHEGRRGSGRKADLPPFTRLAGTRLLHFEGWTPLQWVSKLLRFIEDERISHHNGGRTAAITYMRNHASAADRLSLFDAVQRLSPEGIAHLRNSGLLRSDPFDPTAATAATFPNIAFDFSVAAFDARLRASDPEFYARTGL